MKTTKVRPAQLSRFTKKVWDFYRAHKRNMPWRDQPTSYWVVVSEIMLQQTQVERVMKKFPEFVARFPDWQALAAAPMRAVLEEWSGLGYNRRALFLKRIAEAVMVAKTIELPRTYDELRALPGIGPNTAGSILAFAFNTAHPFIETNIRSAYIHFFFPNIERREGKKACKKISDDEIMPIIEQTLARTDIAANPREWHWALMDYGADLKKRLSNPSRRSAHHVRQSKFEGSNRQLRGRILRFVMEKKRDAAEIKHQFAGKLHSTKKIDAVLDVLVKEGFIVKRTGIYSIK